MAMALILWLCSLPLILFIIVPILGIKAAATVTVAVLLLTLIVCWGICIPALIRLYVQEKWTSDEKTLRRVITRRTK